MRKLLLLIGFVISGKCYCQTIDTVVHALNYTSYFSYILHEPLYVTYRLKGAGGDCSRKGDVFKTGGLPYSATSKDYKGSGYDEGHLADSKDFAYDCLLQEATFRFYNCVPQTPRLNRGIWKHFETIIRKESQTDSLLVIAGSIFGSKKIGENSIAVPDQCFKIVFSMSKGNIIHCLLFPNDNSNTYTDIDIAELQKLIPYTISY